MRLFANVVGMPSHIKEKNIEPIFASQVLDLETGLGMSLSYDLLKPHGGEIEV